MNLFHIENRKPNSSEKTLIQRNCLPFWLMDWCLMFR